MEIGGWLIVALGVLVVACLVPLRARQRLITALADSDERFSHTSRVVKPTKRPGVTGGHGGKVRLHPYARVRRVTSPVVASSVASVAVSRLHSGEGKVEMSAKRHELAVAMRRRSEVRGRAAASAQRRRTLLLVVALVAAVVAALVVFASMPAWLLLLPAAALVAVIFHGVRAANQFAAQLEQAQNRVRAARREVAAEDAQLSGVGKPVSAAVNVEDPGAELFDPQLGAPFRDASAEVMALKEGEESDSAGAVENNESAVEAPLRNEGAHAGAHVGWEPRELPRPLYQMRAVAPRRRIEVPQELWGDTQVSRPRPVRVRESQQQGLTAQQVAAGAAFDFDVDSVIERRRAAS